MARLLFTASREQVLGTLQNQAQVIPSLVIFSLITCVQTWILYSPLLCKILACVRLFNAFNLIAELLGQKSVIQLA